MYPYNTPNVTNTPMVNFNAVQPQYGTGPYMFGAENAPPQAQFHGTPGPSYFPHHQGIQYPHANFYSPETGWVCNPMTSYPQTPTNTFNGHCQVVQKNMIDFQTPSTSSTAPIVPMVPQQFDVRPFLSMIMAKYDEMRAYGEVEQLATYAGRNLFPVLQFTVTGLIPTANYIVALKMVRVSDELQYDSKTARWNKRTEALSARNVPEQSNEVRLQKRSGAQFLANGIDLSDVKIYTMGAKVKNAVAKPNMLLVSTMHRYEPMLTIWQVEQDGSEQKVLAEQFTGGSLIVVSKVKNESISAKRCIGQKHNPYKNGVAKKRSNNVKAPSQQE